MNTFQKLLMTTTVITSVLAGHINLVQAQNRSELLVVDQLPTNRETFRKGQTILIAQSSHPRQTCQNHSSRKTAYSSGWSAGFNGGIFNNTYENERSRNCYDWGYTDGKIEKNKLDMQKMRNDSYIYRMCLSTRLLDPSIQCQQPNY